MDKKVLVVEDNRDISRMLETFLKENGFNVECAYDGNEASVKLANNEYTIILMDLMLPYKDGDQIIRELRTHSNTPVICLSARSGIETRLGVLKMGADDYILKPFDLNEVLVRIEVVLRRTGEAKTPEASPEENILSCGDLHINVKEHLVQYKDKTLSLTSKEQKILTLLLEHPNKTYTKANLYESVWQDEYFYEDNTINVHVSNLRNKLKKTTGQDYIETVWGIGYRLNKEKR